jgi:hypothetical protein
MLVDSSVWLDLVRDPCAPALVCALEELTRARDLILVVVWTVLDEFMENRTSLIEEGGLSISSMRKRVERGTRKTRTVTDELNEIHLRLVSLRDQAAEMVARIEALFAASELVEPTEEVKARAADRGIQRRAPFHRPRNSVRDAILIEVYAGMVALAGRRQRFAFITHNTKDFSHPTVSQKAPHPDLAHLFSKDRSRYFVNLGEALRSIRPDHLAHLVVEQDWLDQPRRKIAEIVSAERELFEKVWYNQHRIQKRGRPRTRGNCGSRGHNC